MLAGFHGGLKNVSGRKGRGGERAEGENGE